MDLAVEHVIDSARDHIAESDKRIKAGHNEVQHAVRMGTAPCLDHGLDPARFPELDRVYQRDVILAAHQCP
jgi:hypothetical protein